MGCGIHCPLKIGTNAMGRFGEADEHAILHSFMNKNERMDIVASLSGQVDKTLSKVTINVNLVFFFCLTVLGLFLHALLSLVRQSGFPPVVRRVECFADHILFSILCV